MIKEFVDFLKVLKDKFKVKSIGFWFLREEVNKKEIAI